MASFILHCVVYVERGEKTTQFPLFMEVLLGSDKSSFQGLKVSQSVSHFQSSQLISGCFPTVQSCLRLYNQRDALEKRWLLIEESAVIASECSSSLEKENMNIFPCYF